MSLREESILDSGRELNPGTGKLANHMAPQHLSHCAELNGRGGGSQFGRCALKCPDLYTVQFKILLNLWSSELFTELRTYTTVCTLLYTHISSFSDAVKINLRHCAVLS